VRGRKRPLTASAKRIGERSRRRIRTIAARHGECPEDVEHASWVVTLHHPEVQASYGRTLSEGLAWCLVWLMVPELGIGQFAI
jgi:hypothetical protein